MNWTRTRAVSGVELFGDTTLSSIKPIRDLQLVVTAIGLFHSETCSTLSLKACQISVRHNSRTPPTNIIDQNDASTSANPAWIALPTMNQPSDDQVKEWLTSPGCGTPFELTKVDVRGHKVNAWKHASASMRELWLDSRANFRKDYLIFIDNSQPLTGPDDQRIKNPAVKLTYADAHFQSAALAWTLLNEYSVQRGDRVAVAARNCVEWIVAFWSIVSIGCVAVPVNAWLPAEGQEYCLKVAECPVILCDGERLRNLLKSGTLDRLREKHGLRRVVSMFPESFIDELDQNRDPDWTSFKSWTGYSTFEDTLRLGAPLARNQGFPPPAGPGPSTIDPDETSTLFFSSGTSGFPKGCVGTHRSYCQTPLTAMYRGVHAAVKKAGGMHGMPAMPKPSDPAKAQLLTTPLFQWVHTSAL